MRSPSNFVIARTFRPLSTHFAPVALAATLLGLLSSNAWSLPPPTRSSNNPRQLPGGVYEPADPRWKERRARDAVDPNWEWKCAIDFYGRVLDEEDRPVADADVHFQWNDLSRAGASSLRTKSDAQGYFALRGQRGKGIIVRVWKPYHYCPKQRLSFEYANVSDANYHEPDPKHPVIFHLRKMNKGEPLVMGSARPILPVDGTPVRIDLLAGSDTAAQAQLELSAVTSTEKYPPRVFDWRAAISVPDGGGLAEHHDEFPFQAPEAAYVPRVEFDMPADSPEWKPFVERNYYIRFGTPARYARIHLRINGANAKPTIDYAVNLTGSRNLEPALTQLTAQELNGSPP